MREFLCPEKGEQVKLGRIWTPSGKVYEYVGVGFGLSYPPIPASVAFTYTPFFTPSIGTNYALQVNFVISAQVGYTPGGGWYWEAGVGGPIGFQFQIFEIREAPFLDK
ncbi:MAG: hypothetical protein QXU40_03660 [Candidatus Pacearchaeota archaeon]